MQLCSVILAGGQSSRMGTDKASLSWHGQPLITHIAQIAMGLTRVCYIVTPWPERYAAAVGDRAQFLTEQQPGGGPLMGFAQGLAAIAPQQDWILLLACDLPHLDPTVLQQWIQNLEAVEPHILAVVPQNGDRWEPLCAFYRPKVLPELQGAIAQGQRSFQPLLNTLAIQPIPLTPQFRSMLQNCNTPEDWQRANY